MVAAGAVVVAAGMTSLAMLATAAACAAVVDHDGRGRGCRGTAFVAEGIVTLVAADTAVVAMVFLKNFRWSRFRPKNNNPTFGVGI